MVVGAGTVLSIGQVHAAYEAGAQFIVSPHTDPEVLKESKRLGLAVMPGALTPTEIVTAYNAGADMVKVFPADGMGMGIPAQSAWTSAAHSAAGDGAA